MTAHRRLSTLVPAALACVLAATVSAGCSTESAGSGASGDGSRSGSSSAAGQPRGSDGQASSGAASGSDGGAEEDDAAGTDDTGDEVESGYDTAAGVTEGAEMPTGPSQPPEAQQTEQPPATALQQASRPLVARPLPAAGQARGRLVTGFPAFLGPGPGSVVRTSSLSPAGDRLQAALTGTSRQDAGTLARSFRVRLARRGLAERETVPGADGSETVSFVRGRSTVTLTVGRDAGTTTYVLYAVLHTEQG